MSSLVDQARRLAAEAHDKQRYGDEPYVKHLADVVDILRRFGINEPSMLAAGYLHDVIEDTDWTAERLTEALSSYADAASVVAIVDACTDGDGANRHERKKRPYRLIPATPGALLVKLADRIANVEACIDRNRIKKLARYREEHAGFRQSLGAGDPRAADMWIHLARLLFEADAPG